MKSIIQIAGLLTVFSALGSATTVSGVLVDSKCYANLRGDTRASLQYVDRDEVGIIRYCAPNFKTGCFELIQLEGGTLVLNSHGNAEALALVRKIGKRRVIWVEVAGVKAGKDMAVSTMKVTKVVPKNGW